MMCCCVVIIWPSPYAAEVAACAKVFLTGRYDATLTKHAHVDEGLDADHSVPNLP